MKFESAEPDAEMHSTTRIDCDVGACGYLDLSSAGKVRNHHDIRASLAIINGYGHALKSSFQELKDQYNEVLEHKDGVADPASSARLLTLEADCRFCLSRLCGSVEQLKASLKAGGILHNSSQDQELP